MSLFDDEVTRPRIAKEQLVSRSADESAVFGCQLVRVSELVKKYKAWRVREAIGECELRRDMVTIQGVRLLTKAGADRVIDYCEKE